VQAEGKNREDVDAAEETGVENYHGPDDDDNEMFNGDEEPAAEEETQERSVCKTQEDDECDSEQNAD
jgi:hypothetical protein